MSDPILVSRLENLLKQAKEGKLRELCTIVPGQEGYSFDRLGMDDATLLVTLAREAEAICKLNLMIGDSK